MVTVQNYLTALGIFGSQWPSLIPGHTLGDSGHGLDLNSPSSTASVGKGTPPPPPRIS